MKRWRSFVTALAALSATFAAMPAAPNLEFVQRIVAERNIRSVDELLSNLPVLLRSRYVLVFASRSLQESSYQNPRAILYGANARFVLTFNGDPGGRGFDAIEMMEFDDATRKFRLQEVIFQRSADGSHRAAFSTINPDRCAICHGQEPRPIWDTHPAWPGAYGELYRGPPSKEQEEGFEAFARSQPSHARYQHLAAVGDFAYRFRFRPSTKERYEGVQVEAPNAELATLLGDLNLKNIAATVSAQPSFEVYKYALLAALTPACTDLEEYFPSDTGSIVTSAFKAFSERSDLLNMQQLERKRARLQQSSDALRFASDASVDDHDSLKRFRFVVEFGLGLSTEGWTLAFEKNSFDFRILGSVLVNLERLVLAEIAREDPGFEQLHLLGSQTHSVRHCHYLSTRSRSNFRQAGAQAEASER